MLYRVFEMMFWSMNFMCGTACLALNLTVFITQPHVAMGSWSVFFGFLVGAMALISGTMLLTGSMKPEWHTQIIIEEVK